MTDLPTGTVEAVCRSRTHTMSKPPQAEVTLVAGIGIEGDAHAGITVKHWSRMEANPAQPNLRQVHLIHGELHDELVEQGYDVGPGVMGENITTRGVDLLGLPIGTRLHLGPDAVIEVTGLRNPCVQLDRLQPGLKGAVLDHDEDGNLVRKGGIMSVVLVGGVLRPGDAIAVELPAEPHRPLEKI